VINPDARKPGKASILIKKGPYVETLPNPKQLTVEKVLITAAEPSIPLLNEGYFNSILSIEDIFGS